MDIINSPVEIQNKTEYFTLEHPIAQAFKNDVSIKILNDGSKSWTEMVYEFNGELTDFTNTQQEGAIFVYLEEACSKLNKEVFPPANATSSRA